MTEAITVLSVNISREKGGPKEGTASAEVSSGGICGDAHEGTPGRSISLLDRGVTVEFARESGIPPPEPGAFGENLTVSMDGPPLLLPGDEIQLGGVRLRVESVGKECHGERCSIYSRTGRCVMPTHGIFCSVLEEGTVSPGMTGTVIRRDP